MKANRIAAANFEYVEAEWDGENRSGFTPLADSVVVMCDVAPDKTAGNLFVTADMQLKQQMMAETGIIVAIGDGAFLWLSDRTRPWEGRKPVIGDRVVFERYAGREQTGLDGKQYRLMSDRCIAALIASTAEYAEAQTKEG
jgi:chaperonin GroES